ncbi:MAG: hypothetical protein A2Z21_06925 [Candidatus Fraserbacteria bacterium RBG_16_55_9]|uniref:Inner membrane protein YgaP-like transmembrane domain-containing protein n=1 Tax=Fraserbacteria sp. (strain RBG_16_55_9) TaxID=1817864 RepID=A0A1F5UPL1_FRAXR|nr:MAG: hypothetical protein A2Z21_06925 [Candidatus Fraserbacteria bacterium RBG_16_55_9]
MDPLNLFGILLGVGVLLLIALAVFRGELSDSERPKYEMLGQEPPSIRVPARPGRLGVEDRVIRLGLVGASFYYSSQLGWAEASGIALGMLGAYLLLTGLVGRDPVYRWRGWDSRAPEHRH